MGFEYAFVHITYNIPLAFGMTAVVWPFLTRLDWAKLTTLIMISLVATIPWDSYLVRQRIWTYPSEAVIGLTLFSIPVEEVFFFFIQTYNTGLLYTIISKRLVLPAFIRQRSLKSIVIGSLIIASVFVAAVSAIYIGGKYTYLGLIISWTSPFLLIQWLVAANFMLAFPRRELIASIMLPTIFLWLLDTISLQRGTWVIEKSTKLDIQVWDGMDIEEAIFFLVTNLMIVSGLVSVDYAIAMKHYQLAQSVGYIEGVPSYSSTIMNLLTSPKKPDPRFVSNLERSTQRVAAASQSMYIGSAMLQGPLRIDLIFFYDFCRVMDDMVDNAKDTEAAQNAIDQCATELETRFATKHKASGGFGEKELTRVIDYLPVSRMRVDPLRELLEGFRIDLMFDAQKNVFPITNESELDRYAYHVAGTVASCVLDLVAHHYPKHPIATDPSIGREVSTAGKQMGQALQLINIARDIGRDAAINRVYIPTTWLREEGITPLDVIACPTSLPVEQLRQRILLKAQALHDIAAGALQLLPIDVRGSLRTTVESYMEIGVALRQGLRPQAASEKLKLSLGRRFIVAYRAMAMNR